MKIWFLNFISHRTQWIKEIKIGDPFFELTEASAPRYCMTRCIIEEEKYIVPRLTFLPCVSPVLNSVYSYCSGSELRNKHQTWLVSFGLPQCCYASNWWESKNNSRSVCRFLCYANHLFCAFVICLLWGKRSIVSYIPSIGPKKVVP